MKMEKQHGRILTSVCVYVAAIVEEKEQEVNFTKKGDTVLLPPASVLFISVSKKDLNLYFMLWMKSPYLCTGARLAAPVFSAPLLASR